MSSMKASESNQFYNHKFMVGVSLSVRTAALSEGVHSPDRFFKGSYYENLRSHILSAAVEKVLGEVRCLREPFQRRALQRALDSIEAESPDGQDQTEPSIRKGAVETYLGGLMATTMALAAALAGFLAGKGPTDPVFALRTPRTALMIQTDAAEAGLPLMDEASLKDLAADIKANGLLEPIDVYEGKILDGRNRYNACKIARVEPAFREVCPPDPVAYVLSRNLRRRHLDVGQRAMIGDKARTYYAQQAKERQRKHSDTAPGKPAVNTSGTVSGSDFGEARDQAGKAVGVSGPTMDKARKVREQGHADLVKAVETGKLDVTKLPWEIPARHGGPNSQLPVLLPEAENLSEKGDSRDQADAAEAGLPWLSNPAGNRRGSPKCIGGDPWRRVIPDGA